MPLDVYFYLLPDVLDCYRLGPYGALDVRRRKMGVLFMGNEERMLRWFRPESLPAEKQQKMDTACEMFADLAVWVSVEIGSSAERTVTFRKLLEARDAAIRAIVEEENVHTAAELETFREPLEVKETPRKSR